MSGITKFIEEFSVMEDPRVEGLVTYPLNEILLVTLCGVLSGSQEIGRKSNVGELKWLKKFLPFENGIPRAQTFNRVFNTLDSKTFKTCFESWVEFMCFKQAYSDRWQDDQRLETAVKWRRSGAFIVSICERNRHGCWPRKSCRKSNEITAIPELLDT